MSDRAGPAPSPISPFTRLILLRHGQAEGNREFRYLGVTDAPLTATGREQARRLAAAILPFHPAAIYSSPLARARDTARALADVTGLPVTLREDLREMDFGAWEDRTRADVLTEFPHQLAAWETSAEAAPPGGESLAAVSTRVVACADALAAAHPGQTLALVSHVGPIKALVCAALTLPPTGVQHMWLDPASYCIVDWPAPATLPDTVGASGGRPHGGRPPAILPPAILRVFNALAHLDPPTWVGH